MIFLVQFVFFNVGWYANVLIRFWANFGSKTRVVLVQNLTVQLLTFGGPNKEVFPLRGWWKLRRQKKKGPEPNLTTYRCNYANFNVPQKPVGKRGRSIWEWLTFVLGHFLVTGLPLFGDLFAYPLLSPPLQHSDILWKVLLESSQIGIESVRWV